MVDCAEGEGDASTVVVSNVCCFCGLLARSTQHLSAVISTVFVVGSVDVACTCGPERVCISWVDRTMVGGLGQLVKRLKQ